MPQASWLDRTGAAGLQKVAQIWWVQFEFHCEDHNFRWRACEFEVGFWLIKKKKMPSCAGRLVNSVADWTPDTNIISAFYSPNEMKVPHEQGHADDKFNGKEKECEANKFWRFWRQGLRGYGVACFKTICSGIATIHNITRNIMCITGVLLFASRVGNRNHCASLHWVRCMISSESMLPPAGPCLLMRKLAW